MRQAITARPHMTVFLMRRIVTTLILSAAALIPPAACEVPQLAAIKAAAEAGDPKAQYAFANSFSRGSQERNKWLNTSAAQGYGQSEDELAWDHSHSFSFDCGLDNRTTYLESRKACMLQALLYASSAADKGFNRSRLVLGYAYAHGYLLPQDRIEAYKWMKLAGSTGIINDITANRVREELLKTMSLEEVKEGESRAANYHPGDTVRCIKTALVIPNLMLSGIASIRGQPVAVVNGTKLTAGLQTQVSVAETPICIKCLSIDEKTVVITLPPDEGQWILRPGSTAVRSN